MKSKTKTCQNCKNKFVIEPVDFEFYKKIEVPEPTWCFECRLTRRLIWRNERALYKRTCSLCDKEIIAMYPADTPFPVCCRSCWYSDKWDALDYGKSYDYSKSFFEQFKNLLKLVPRIALQVDNCQNCDYANQIANSKNCYLVTSGDKDEDCYYSHRLLDSRDVVDCLSITKGERCYESIECSDSSRLKVSTDCADSLDLSFCYDIKGGQNCFMSSNLRRGSYYFNNERFSKEAFQEKMRQIQRTP